MDITKAIVEEMVEDTKRLAASWKQWVDRWGKYGDQFEPHLTESQREEVRAAIQELEDAISHG